MAIRISQRQMFTSMISNMNGNLAALMESNIQASSEKRVNRPSDDPYGSAQILASRATLSSIDQYKKNLSIASGWLQQADSTLGLVHDELTRLYALVEQAATGTLSADQRHDIAYEARGIFEQLLSYGNTRFGGRYIFSGHKTDEPSFVGALGVTCNDDNLAGAQYVVRGDSPSPVLIQVTQNGTIDSSGGSNPTFRYSSDGGKTWANGSWNAGPPASMQAGGVQVEVQGTTPHTVTAVDPTNIHENNNGTWMFVRPTAIYQGDVNGAQAVQQYGNSVNAVATGNFSRDVAVRLDSISGGRVTYSYSIDDGQNWVTGSSPIGGSVTELPVPGGFLTVNSTFTGGEQFVIRPQRADINLAIGSNASITTNLIGLDVFGGLFNRPFSTVGSQPVYGGDSRNMFEVVGRAVAALETNSQQGVQAALVEVKTAMENVISYRTAVGGRVNRATAIGQQLDSLKLDESEHLSAVEDIDVAELMTRLSQQQLAYNAVLKSSSMIMQMNLMNFL